MGNNTSALKCECCREEKDDASIHTVYQHAYAYAWDEEVCSLRKHADSWRPEQGCNATKSLAPSSGNRNNTSMAHVCPADPHSKAPAQSLPLTKGAESIRATITGTTPMSTTSSAGQPSVSERNRLVFTIRPGDRFGMQLAEDKGDDPGGALVVVNVETGTTFSRTADGHPGIFPGDTILEVNGRSGHTAILRNSLQQLVTSGSNKQVCLLVQPRPPVFDVELNREGPAWQKLGVSVAVDKVKGESLIVLAVRDEGLVPTWNARCGTTRVCVGDWVTHVNGISHNAEKMCTAVQGSHEGSKLSLRVVTPMGYARYNDSHDVKAPKEASDTLSTVSTASTGCSVTRMMSGKTLALDVECLSPKSKGLGP